MIFFRIQLLTKVFKQFYEYTCSKHNISNVCHDYIDQV